MTVQTYSKEEIDQLVAKIEQWQKYADHLPDCSCLDKMDSGRLFPRHDWQCSCGLRKLLPAKEFACAP